MLTIFCHSKRALLKDSSIIGVEMYAEILDYPRRSIFLRSPDLCRFN